MASILLANSALLRMCEGLQLLKAMRENLDDRRLVSLPDLESERC